MASSNLGAELRAYGLGLFSMVDTLTDVTVIVEFFETGRTGFAYAMLTMIVIGLIINVGLVIASSRNLKKDRFKTMAFDVMTVLCFAKPGWDAHQVAKGVEEVEGAALSPWMHLMTGRCIELTTEAVPALVLQAYALVTLEERSWTMVASLAISAMSAAMITTSVFYDVDSSPSVRVSHEECGLIHDQVRERSERERSERKDELRQHGEPLSSAMSATEAIAKMSWGGSTCSRRSREIAEAARAARPAAREL
jgi:hypothetical protein